LGRALSGEPLYGQGERLGDLDGDGLIELRADPATVLAYPLGPPREADGTILPENLREFEDKDGDGKYDAGLLVKLKNWLEVQAMPQGPLGDVLETLRGQGVETLTSLARPAGTVIAEGIDSVAAWAGGLIQALTLLVLIPFYLFFFLVEYPSMTRRLRDLVPPRHREQVDRITRDIGKEQVAFLRGRLMCGLVKAALLYTGMLILRIEFALPIALVTGVLSLIPMVGFIVGVVPATVIALTMPGGGTETAVWTMGVFVFGEAVEGAVLFPLLLGKETGLHPVTLVVVLLAGGALMGTLGVIVAIPLALVCKVLWRELGLPLYRAWAETQLDEDAKIILVGDESPGDVEIDRDGESQETDGKQD
jgi:predicted PurR-regulated permease PerM